MSYFLKRCDSMLAHINFVGRVNTNDIHEDDYRVIQKLLSDRKIKVVGNDYVGINSPLYFAREAVHPVVFHLASANPSNEGFVTVFRKNEYVPELPEYVAPVEDVVDTELAL